MRREVTLEEISDGRLYDANDMVKADCQDCKGCHDCCLNLGFLMAMFCHIWQCVEQKKNVFS